ncbi:MAG: hypothetical protein WBP55_07795 [Solirubrobacterales bacterium]
MLFISLALVDNARAQRVDGVPNKASTAPVNLQLTPTGAFVRIRGWSLPAPLLPLSILGNWGGKGTISGAGAVNIPVGQISTPSQFQFPRDINGEEETMTVSLFKRGDWNGELNPITGEAVMDMPMTLKIEASHVRMVDIPWPGGWIYGNIECEVPFNFGPMTTGLLDVPDPAADPVPVTRGTPYDPATGELSVINNSMTVGGFDCSRPDIGASQVEDELNDAVNIPSPVGRTDAMFNLTFLEGGNIIRPIPAIRPEFKATPAAPLNVAFDAGPSYAKAGAERYIWDFDSDGEADTSTASPKITRTFPAAGSQTVGLKLVDSDGDESPWVTKDVVVSDEVEAGTSTLAPLKVKPKKRKAAPGSMVRFRVRVGNAGTAAASEVRICVKAPKKLVRMKKRCKPIGELAAGESAARKISVKLGGKAKRGRSVTLKFRAMSGNGQTVKAKARIKAT